MKELVFIVISLLAPFAAAQCVNHEGLLHCGKGNTTLTTVNGVLIVDGSGVDISFAPVASWNAILDRTNSAQMQIDATDNGQTFSSLIMNKTNQSTLMSSNFTGQSGGSPATLMLYMGGNLKEFVSDVSVAIIDPDEDDDDMDDDDNVIGPERVHFINQSTNGACIWTISYQEIVKVTVNGHIYTADQIAFVEQMGSGHYPYTSFNGISIYNTGQFQIGLEAVGSAP